MKKTTEPKHDPISDTLVLPEAVIRIYYFFGLPDRDLNSGSDPDPPFLCQQQRCFNFYLNYVPEANSPYRSYEPIPGIERGYLVLRIRIRDPVPF
jgi:hypothetical protein